MKNLNVVLKITERCNLNCSYCYYFNGLDNSFKSKPAAMKENVVMQVARFLINAVADYEIDSINLTLHGGEPLLLNKNSFSRICDTLTSNLKPKLKNLKLTIQTNGTLINKNWIEIFRQYNIEVGISLDGSRENHDFYRVDHKGNGSYDKILKSISLLREQDYDFGILSVIDPTYNPEEVFNQLVLRLEVNGMDFLWPDFTHDNPAPYSALDYGIYVSRLFNKWVQHGDQKVKIRFFSSHINLMLGLQGLIYGQSLGDFKEAMHVIAIRSDGEICPTDELMSTNPLLYSETGKTVFDTTLREFLTIPAFHDIEAALKESPQQCKTCCWSNSCGGGSLVNRYSSKNRFDNPSIYCDGLKHFYTTVVGHLLKNGIKVEEIAKNLKL